MLRWAKQSNIDEIQASSWYSCCLYAYRWDDDRYMVHIYCLSGSNGTHSTIVMVKKRSFWFVDGGLRPQYQTEYRSMIIGELFFLSSFGKPPSRLVHNVQEGSNQPIQPEGWPRQLLLQLLSDLPLLFRIKTFSVVDKIYNFFFEKLNYSTAFFAVLHGYSHLK